MALRKNKTPSLLPNAFIEICEWLLAAPISSYFTPLSQVKKKSTKFQTPSYNICDSLSFLITVSSASGDNKYLEKAINICNHYFDSIVNRTYPQVVGEIPLIFISLYEYTKDVNFICKAQELCFLHEELCAADEDLIAISDKNFLTRVRLCAETHSNTSYFDLNKSIYFFFQLLGERALYTNRSPAFDVFLGQNKADESLFKFALSELSVSLNNMAFNDIKNIQTTKGRQQKAKPNDGFLMRAISELLMDMHGFLLKYRLGGSIYIYQPPVDLLNSATSVFGTTKGTIIYYILTGNIYLLLWKINNCQEYKDLFDECKEKLEHEIIGNSTCLSTLEDGLIINTLYLPFINIKTEIAHPLWATLKSITHNDNYPGITLTIDEIKDRLFSINLPRVTTILKVEFPSQWYTFLNELSLSNIDSFASEVARLVKSITFQDELLRKQLLSTLDLELKKIELAQFLKDELGLLPQTPIKYQKSKFVTNLPSDEIEKLVIKLSEHVNILKVYWYPGVTAYNFTFRQFISLAPFDHMGVWYNSIVKKVEDMKVEESYLPLLTNQGAHFQVKMVIENMLNQIPHLPEFKNEVRYTIEKVVKDLIDKGFVKVIS